MKQIENGSEPRIYWLFRDITERERAAQHIRELNETLEARVRDRTAALARTNEELRRANAAKNDFLSMVSHELRTPLTVALGNARILVSHRKHLSEEDLEQSLKDIVRSGDKLQQLIENLMILARVETALPVLIEPVNLGRSIPDLVKELAPQWPDRSFEVSISESLPICSGIPAYIEQILANLLSNAAKYAPKESSVRIYARQGKQSVGICVSNDGPGIAEGERQAIFQAFYRGAATQQSQSGVGIGLTVVKRLVEAQGGRIWLSKSIEGTTFCFNLRYWREPLN